MKQMNSDKNENWLLKAWKNEKSKALLKLGMWFIFFIFVGLFLFITEPQNKVEKPKEQQKEPTKEADFLTINEMFEVLKSSDYNYEYSIKSADDLITLKGEKRKNQEIGYKESKLGIIKYKKENDKVYQIFQETEEELSNFLDVEDEKYLNLENIEAELLNSEKNEHLLNHQRKITIQSDVTIMITTDEKNIQSIEIYCEAKHYNLSFKIQ